MKKTVAYIVFGDMLPTDVGNKKAMFEYFRYLVAQPEYRLVLCLVGNVPEAHQKIYREMGAELRLIKPSWRWNCFEILNKLASRLQFDMFRSFFSGLAYRTRIQRACADADVILMIYAGWFEVLTRQLLKAKTIVLTFDLFFYRRASIGGVNTWWKRTLVYLNRRLEIAVLRKFRKIAVLADYERDILVQNGIDAKDIIKIGMPLTIPPRTQPPIPFAQRKYDFFLISSPGPENQQLVRMFIEKVVPLLPPRKMTFALAGGICKMADLTGLPDNIEVVKLGFVDNPEEAFAQAKIGVGTVTCGSGIKVKVVEMAMHGLPVIVTNSGAEGIPLSGGGFINIDQVSEDALRDKLNLWLANPDQAQKEGTETGMGVRYEFSAERVMKDLFDLLL